MKFGETSFQTKLLSRLSHKVFHLLSSPALLRKFTIMAFIFLMMQGKFFFSFILTFPGGYVCDKTRQNKGCDQRLLINNSPCNMSEHGLLG